MATKRVHVGIGPRRQRTQARYPSEGAFISSMRHSAESITKALLSVMDQMENVSAGVMLEALEPTLQKAEYYTPKDTLELVNSSYLEQTDFRGTPRVEIGFAKGGSPDYAIYVHEILEYKHDEPTRAKFLEYAVMEDLTGIYERIGAGYQQFMRGGGG